MIKIRKKISFVLIIFFIININFLNCEDINYTINLVAESMSYSNNIRPAISDNGYLYIITGESSQIDIDDFKPSDINFTRYILKFDMNSGILLSKSTYNSKYPFQNAEAIVIGDKSQYILATTMVKSEIYDGQLSFESELKVYPNRRYLKKVGEFILYPYIRLYNYKYFLDIRKYVLGKKDNNDLYLKVYQGNHIENIDYLSMTSCDLIKDNNDILCVYISGEDNFLNIDVFNFVLQKKQTIKIEVADHFIKEKDYFIKIAYFKDNSKFVLLYSKDNYVVRLRYFEYKDNKIINNLYPIIRDKADYLDVDETQLNGYYYSNDMIVVNEDKIIKIFSGDDKIIITVFQFYEHDTVLAIKIYNMNNFNKFGFNKFTQPRIEMFKDTLLVCLSTYHRTKQTTGFLFLNYPNSKEIQLNNNRIKIKELIVIENNIFSLNFKLKILKLPKDFILISLLNSKEIKENDVLDVNDELILKQYRIREGPYEIKYVGIASGNDLGYSSSKIYPTDRSMPDTKDIYIEGKHGKITINFSNCLNDYYYLDYDEHLCTNEKPKGYYIDGRAYRACKAPCRECSGPIQSDTHMNCLTCIENYFITEDTNSCYNTEPDNYYLDKDIFRRCYERCKKCITFSNDINNMNCLECKSGFNYFYRKDTHNCILPTKYRDEKNLKISSNIFAKVFLIIALLSLVIAFIILLTCCCKEKLEINNNVPIQRRIELPNINNNLLSINDSE